MVSSHSSAKGAKHFRRNEQIRVPEVILVDQEGNKLGTYPTPEAISYAEEKSLDLVEVSPMSSPPVCRVMDYGKFLFDEKKRLAQSKRNQKKIQTKEIKFRPATDVGDYKIKIRTCIRFLQEGDKLKVTVRFRGRENARQELGVELIQQIEKDLMEYGKLSTAITPEMRQLSAIFLPLGDKGASQPKPSAKPDA